MALVENSKDLVDITPDVRLLRVLRNSGFELETAMGELLDNSVDAGAKDIRVFTYINNQQKRNVMIVDDGKGMTEGNLAHSLTLAKELKVGIDQLGKFGMGMKTAALSLTTQFEIMTKTLSGELIYGEFNINKMEALGEFKTDVRKASPVEESFFYSRLGKKGKSSGTIIIMKSCDRLDMGSTIFVKKMERFIGLTYKNYITKGLDFAVSDTPTKGESVSPIDPLMMEFESTQVAAHKEVVPVEFIQNGNRRTSLIEISASVIPKPTNNGRTAEGKEIKLTINQNNQGIYFYREGRMVGRALTWANIFGKRHNSKNRFRIEINCKSDLDDEIRMNFQKGNVAPTTMFKDQLSKVIQPLIGRMREQLKPEEIQEETLGGQSEHKVSNPAGHRERDVLSGFNPSSNSKVQLMVKTPQRRRTQRKPLEKNKAPEHKTYANFNQDELLSAAFTIGNLLKDSEIPNDVKEVYQEALGLVTA